MKYFILFLYVVLAYFIIPYLFSYLGAFRKVAHIAKREIDRDNTTLDEIEKQSYMRMLGHFFFFPIATYLYITLGCIFGLACVECFQGFKELGFLLFGVLLFSSFRLSENFLEKSYRIPFSNQEQLLFSLITFFSYTLAFWDKKLLPIFFCWYWIY